MNKIMNKERGMKVLRFLISQKNNMLSKKVDIQLLLQIPYN